MITKQVKVKEQQPMAIEDLYEGGIYMTDILDFVQIRGIDKKRNKLHIYNITESCNVFLDLTKHHLIKRIR